MTKRFLKKSPFAKPRRRNRAAPARPHPRRSTPGLATGLKIRTLFTTGGEYKFVLNYQSVTVKIVIERKDKTVTNEQLEEDVRAVHMIFNPCGIRKTNRGTTPLSLRMRALILAEKAGVQLTQAQVSKEMENSE
jgi:hypothetical protein